MADSRWDRFALWLWRDRYEYDPTIGEPGAQHNVSLWTKLRPARARLFGALLSGQLWLCVLAGAFGIGATLLAHHLQAVKPDQQVKPDAGELLLRCVQESNGVLSCRPLSNGQQKVVPSSNSNRLDNNGTA